MKISCKNPVVIRHKLIKEYLYKCSYYSILGEIHFITKQEKYQMLHDDKYLAKVFSTYMIDFNNELDDYILIDGVTGQCFPIFQVLPCNKCVICRDRNTKQWMTRAFAENSTSKTPPLFITLTYNDWCIPPCGLLKEHVQLFMKRLRKRLSDDGYDCNIRFFLCGEYGKNTARPHYHLLLWNFPYMMYFDMQDYIQDAWSVIIDKDEYKSINNKDIVYTEEVLKWNIGIRKYESVILYRKRLGFVFPLYVQTGAASYVMKYMRKEPTIPEHCVAPFQLYSRRGGIGCEWIDNNKDFYLENPDVLDVEIYDKWTDSTHKSVLPLYYAQRVFPSRSKLLSKAIRDVFDEWSYYGQALEAMRKGFFGIDSKPLHSDILDKFDMLTPTSYTKFIDLVNALVLRHTDYVAFQDDVHFFEHSLEDIKEGNFKSSRINAYLPECPIFYTFWNTDKVSPDYGKPLGVRYHDNFKKWLVRLYTDYSREYDFLSEILRGYPLDKTEYENAVKLKGWHDTFVSEFVRSQPELQLEEYEEYLIRRMVDSERKEIF